MPLLRVGEHEISHYEAHWLEGVLRQAAREAGHEGWWPASDIAKGVLQFLQERFDRNIITLHELFQKIGQTLRSIGFPEVASRVKEEPPPMELSLRDLLHDCEGLEMLFFTRMTQELRGLRDAGATRLEMTHLREAVLRLSAAPAWNARCAGLEAEIVEHARLVFIGHAPQGPCTLLVGG